MARVLLTGASAFSGLWIAEALAAAGHAVTAPLRRPREGYDGLRASRVARLDQIADVRFDTSFGSEAFLGLIEGGGFEVLAHHAADIPGYREPTYDVGAGVARNLAGARPVLRAFARAGGRALIATGTTFEAGEGGEGPAARAVSPYGLSKGLTNEALRHLAGWEHLAFGKFVVAAPFGRWEEGRFVWTLFRSWFRGEPGQVRTPAYVRDNIPAPLLGAAYAAFAERVLAQGGEQVCRPAGFVGAQEAFARRVAEAASARLGFACEIEAPPQREFAEPLVRVNDQPAITSGWDEAAFWDDYVAYYREVRDLGLLDAVAG